MKTQHKTKKASGSQRIPQNFAIGAKVEDIYTGKISTVSKIYWQNYAGGNTSDYTVEFAEGGWNKSQNLKASVAPESDVKRMKLTPDEIAYGKFYAAIDANKAQGKPESYATKPAGTVKQGRRPMFKRFAPESDAEGRDQEFGPNWREHFPAEAQGKPGLPLHKPPYSFSGIVGDDYIMAQGTSGREKVAEVWNWRDKEYIVRCVNHAEALAEALRRIIRDDDLAAMRHAETMLANWEGVKQ